VALKTYIIYPLDISTGPSFVLPKNFIIYQLSQRKINPAKVFSNTGCCIRIAPPSTAKLGHTTA